LIESALSLSKVMQRDGHDNLICQRTVMVRQGFADDMA
jgi:hypothetical protein